MDCLQQIINICLRLALAMILILGLFPALPLFPLWASLCRPLLPDRRPAPLSALPLTIQLRN